MKIKHLPTILLGSILLLGTQTTQAQHTLQQIIPITLPSLKKAPDSSLAHHHSPAHGMGHIGVAAKPADAMSRLLAITMLKYDSSAYAPADSFIFSYPGKKGEGRLNTDSVGSGIATWPFDTLSIQIYNPPTATYTNVEQLIKAYDNNNNILTTTITQWVPYLNSFRTVSRTMNTYDANNYLQTRVDQNWDTIANQWVDAKQAIYTYTGANMTTELDQVSVSNAWVNANQHTYTYDMNNNQLSELDQVWTSGAWLSTYQYTYTYNSANFELSEFDQYWTSGAWVNSYQYAYTLDASNNTTEETDQEWQSGTWVNTDQYLYTFDGSNNMLTNTEQQWGISSWDNNQNDIYTYDGNHNRLSDITQHWNSDDSVWVNNTRIESTYNAMDQVLIANSNTWDTSGKSWLLTTGDEQDRFYYELYNTGVTNVNKGGDVKIFPNPANNDINIDLNWMVQQSATIAIYDASGRICRQWQVPEGNSYHAQIPVRQLAAGNYFIQVKGQQGQLQKTITITH